MKEIEIFHKRQQLKKGIKVKDKPTKLHNSLYFLARWSGAALFVLTVLFLGFSLGPVVWEEVKYEVTAGGKSDEVVEVSINKDEVDQEQIKAEADQYGVGTDFSVVIPKIDAKSNVIANVNAARRESYEEALKKGVAHARGTYFPGQGQRIYLFSHSVGNTIDFNRYNAVFYLISKLEIDDEIIVYFSGRRYVYSVEEKQVVSADDTQWLEANTAEEELVLQTCDPPGTSWKRLLVIAKPISQ